MRYFLLATDFDGTLAEHGNASETTLQALARLRASGRRLVLVTGRTLDDLLTRESTLQLFDRVVAENGAVLYSPVSREEQLLAAAPPADLLDALRQHQVRPLDLGRVIVSTDHSQAPAVLDTIAALGLEYQLVFNKGALMVLPSGVNKATGLASALDQLKLSPHNTVGIGDAENDHAFLAECECAVAVANALPSLKEQADLVTQANAGAGVAELIDQLLADDLQHVAPRLARHDLLLGRRDDEPVMLPAYGASLLVAGTSGSGKSTLADGLLERITDAGYQLCVVDPEGDYEAVANTVVHGDSDHSPQIDEVLQLLENPRQQVVVNLLGIPLDDRPAFFDSLLPRLQELRARAGRPHWILIDEAHHLLPSDWRPTGLTVPRELAGIILVTVHPDRLSKQALGGVHTVVTLGEGAADTMRAAAAMLETQIDVEDRLELASEQALAWDCSLGPHAFGLQIVPPRVARRRHVRKYLTGDLGEHLSFYFRGPDNRLELRAQNLQLFLQLGDGVDDETWLFHLRNGDYTDWFKTAIKDTDLADQAAALAQRDQLSAAEGRAALADAVNRRYTGRCLTAVIDLWYKNAVLYCLDVGTFADGNGDGIGDLPGLADRLPYLAGIGVTCVWLLPFYPSPRRDDGYDIQDYYNVDPRYGTLGDFVDFMRQADEFGIRVIVDLVVNHTSDQHPWFQAARTDPKSSFRDWYIWSERKPADASGGVVFPGVQKTTWTFDRRARAYYFHRFYDFQPDLNVANPDVREEIERIMGFWLQLGVTGFRIDAAPFIIQDKTRLGASGPEDYAWLTEFRQFLSWRRGDAMMLAEANVMPPETLNFFGQGDRMHLLFNFWANQHLFLAMAREDASILRSAMEDLPALPPTAQWANFLRNNDELDLGRLSDADRERCFQAFAPEPTMQLYGRGIRRRLAPMLQGDRRRLELMNSLLFTLPGTPVIRYGEEIGMGDNLSLPERNAIRTPMQWSARANGGFSVAPPERLSVPAIDAGEYRFEQVNVALQRLHDDSFLNWTERAIRTRKECPEFGWGDLAFLPTSQPEVLAHACTWKGRTVAAVHNFSRARRTVEVEWPDGTQNVQHLFGRGVPERAQGLLDVVDLDGYDYRWVRLDIPR